MESYIPPVNVLVEGDTDEAVVRRVLDYVGLDCGTVYGKMGKSTADHRWRPEAALNRSDSLRRCLAALQALEYFDVQ